MIVESWRYTTACFKEALGFLQQFAVLRCEEMVMLSQTNYSVSNAASILGEAYMYRARGYFEFTKHRKRLDHLATEQRNILSRQIRDRAATWATAPVASVLMIMLINITLDGNTDPAQPWMADVSDFIIRTTKGRQDLPSFDKDLIRLCQLVDVLNSVSRFQYPGGSDFTSGILHTEPTSVEQIKLLTPCLLNDDVDYIMSAVWNWGILQRRMIEWVDDTVKSPSPYLSPEEKVKGIEIICEASSLQSRLLRCYMDLPNDSEFNHQLLALYSYWTLVGISQQLRHPHWRMLRCDLPVMALDQLHQYALTTLDSIGELTDRAGLSAAMFLPVVLSMGFEMTTNEDRNRALDLLGNTQARYFDFSPKFQWRLLGSWG
ncbi:hypothetical protein FQN54_005454 [Arachnomyces sp. PD_36]|nr:hypothetical protein FQN54_005454 [Arachnomyces sp. PD_36]